MVTKWALTEPKDFDDIGDILSAGIGVHRLLTARPAERPISCGLRTCLHFREATLTHDFLIRTLCADNWQFRCTFEQLAQSLAGYYMSVYPVHITKIEPVAKYAFEEGKAYFERNKEILTRRYEGKYIAIWENDVLDSDPSFSSLAQRVYEKLGYVSIYMPFVTSKRRMLRFESPEHRRSKANAS